MSKGDSPRPVDPVKYRENWDRIFKRADEASAAIQRYREALDEMTRMEQEDGFYGPTEGP